MLQFPEMPECYVKLTPLDAKEYFNDEHRRYYYICTIKGRFGDLLKKVSANQRNSSYQRLEDECFEKALNLFEPDSTKQLNFLRSAHNHVCKYRNSVSYAFRSCLKTKEIEEQLWELRQYFQLGLETEGLFNKHRQNFGPNGKIYLDTVSDVMSAITSYNSLPVDDLQTYNQKLIPCVNIPNYLPIQSKKFLQNHRKKRKLEATVINLESVKKPKIVKKNNKIYIRSLSKVNDSTHKIPTAKRSASRNNNQDGVFKSINLDEMLENSNTKFQFEKSAPKLPSPKPVETTKRIYVKPWQEVVLKAIPINQVSNSENNKEKLNDINNNEIQSNKTNMNGVLPKTDKVPITNDEQIGPRMMSIKEKIKNEFKQGKNITGNETNTANLPIKIANKVENDPQLNGNSGNQQAIESDIPSVYRIQSNFPWKTNKDLFIQSLVELNKKFTKKIFGLETLEHKTIYCTLNVTFYGNKPIQFFKNTEIPETSWSAMVDLLLVNYYERRNFKSTWGNCLRSPATEQRGKVNGHDNNSNLATLAHLTNIPSLPFEPAKLNLKNGNMQSTKIPDILDWINTTNISYKVPGDNQPLIINTKKVNIDEKIPNFDHKMSTTESEVNEIKFNGIDTLNVVSPINDFVSKNSYPNSTITFFDNEQHIKKPLKWLPIQDNISVDSFREKPKTRTDSKELSDKKSSSHSINTSEDISMDSDDDDEDDNCITDVSSKTLSFSDRFKKWKFQQMFKELREAICIPSSSNLSTLKQAKECIEFLKQEDEYLIKEKSQLLEKRSSLQRRQKDLSRKYSSLVNPNRKSGTLTSEIVNGGYVI